MSRLLSFVLVFVVPLACAARNDSFSAASELAYEIIGSQAQNICQPALIPDTTRKSLVSALAKITESGLVDASGLTPLDYAVIADDIPAIKRFVGIGYPLTTKDGTLLHGAALHGSKRATSFLLENDIDPSITNQYQTTPLMVAAAESRLDIARMLIYAGSPVNIRNKNGGTALHYAIGCRSQALINLLLDSGAVVDPKARNLASKYNLSLEQDKR